MVRQAQVIVGTKIDICAAGNLYVRRIQGPYQAPVAQSLRLG
jgi:hypothetical protein